MNRTTSVGLHVDHGRTLPIATGVKLANRDLTVIAAGAMGTATASVSII